MWRQRCIQAVLQNNLCHSWPLWAYTNNVIHRSFVLIIIPSFKNINVAKWWLNVQTDFNVSTMKLCVMVILDVMTSQTSLQRFAMVCGVLIAPSVFSNLYLLSILYVLLRNDVLDLCFILLYKNEDSPSRKVFSVLSSFFLVFVQYFVVFFVCKWRPWPWILFRFIRLKINQVN